MLAAGAAMGILLALSGGDARGGEPAEQPNALTPEEEAGLIDKGRIAEETYARLLGLREAGNPHIREGLEIGRIEEEPERTEVDMERLHEEAIRQVEERPDFSRPVHDDPTEAADILHHDHPGHEACGPESAPRPVKDPNTVTIVLLGTLGVILIGAVFFYARRRGD